MSAFEKILSLKPISERTRAIEITENGEKIPLTIRPFTYREIEAIDEKNDTTIEMLKRYVKEFSELSKAELLDKGWASVDDLINAVICVGNQIYVTDEIKAFSGMCEKEAEQKIARDAETIKN